MRRSTLIRATLDRWCTSEIPTANQLHWVFSPKEAYLEDLLLVVGVLGLEEVQEDDDEERS